MEYGITLNGTAFSTRAFLDEIQGPAKAVWLHNSAQEKSSSIDNDANAQYHVL